MVESGGNSGVETVGGGSAAGGAPLPAGGAVSFNGEPGGDIGELSGSSFMSESIVGGSILSGEAKISESEASTDILRLSECHLEEEGEFWKFRFFNRNSKTVEIST